MTDLALYLHIPFCRQRCRYCDFTSSTGRESLIPAYRSALIRELDREAPIWNESRIRTIFFGGGTPSLWPVDELCRVLDAIGETGRVDNEAEISLEANPGTVDRAGLTVLRRAGFNRISLGAQSGEDRLLKAIGRIHGGHDVESAVDAARRAGFANLNLDLIFGLPDQTVADWERTLRWAMDLGPEHLSCYGLQLEEGTLLEQDVTAGRVAIPTEDESADMLALTLEFLPQAGYSPYEISNYCRPGYECRHNLQYWNAGDYLGIGAGAVSTVGERRWTNPESIEDYIAGADSVEGPSREVEILSRRDRMAEAIMLGLRLRRGIDKSAFARKFGISIHDLVGPAIGALIKEGWLMENPSHLTLSEQAVPVSNAIIARVCSELLSEST